MKKVKSAKDKAVSRAISNLSRKGTVKNITAINFVASFNPRFSDFKKLSEIWDKLKHCSSPKESPLSIHKILEPYDFYAKRSAQALDMPVIENLNVGSGVRHETKKISDTLSITDMTTLEQDINDEYNFIFNLPNPKRIYLVSCTENVGDFSFIFSNYVFGNFTLDSKSKYYDEKKLSTTFVHGKIMCSVINSLGFISLYNPKECTPYIIQNIFEIYCKTANHVKLVRNDHSAVSVLQVGAIIVSKADEPIDVLGQYLIVSSNKKGEVNQFYLCYGKIDFDLIKTSPQYKYDAANILLAEKNLAESCYIGSMEDEYLRKKEIPFGEPIISIKKDVLELLKQLF